MNNCNDLFILAAIACKLTKCLNEDELSVLSANLVALGDMLAVALAHNTSCSSSNAADS